MQMNYVLVLSRLGKGSRLSVKVMIDEFGNNPRYVTCKKYHVTNEHCFEGSRIKIIETVRNGNKGLDANCEDGPSTFFSFEKLIKDETCRFELVDFINSRLIHSKVTIQIC